MADADYEYYDYDETDVVTKTIEDEYSDEDEILALAKEAEAEADTETETETEADEYDDDDDTDGTGAITRQIPQNKVNGTGSDDSELLIKVLTMQSGPIKTVFETLASLLVDCNILFTPEGIKICTMNRMGNVFVDLDLIADKFADYEHNYFKEGTTDRIDFIAGVRLEFIFKIIKIISSGSVIAFFVHKDEQEKLGITFENAGDGEMKNFGLKLLNLNVNRNLRNFDVSLYDTVIMMKSSFFQKLCRDCSTFSQTIEFKSHKGVLHYSLDSDGSIELNTTIAPSNEGDDLIMKYVVNRNPNEIIQGRYELKYLVSFTKCTNISTTVTLYLSNKLPLQIEYQVGQLGHVRMAIGQKLEKEDL